MKNLISLLLIMLIVLYTLVAIGDGSEPINILLLGSDNFGYASVTDIEEVSRSDAIFLLSIQPNTNHIKLLSIERDYLVILPDGLGENKLATSSYFGGPHMALKAVNQLFDLKISLFAHIDIKNFITSIDFFGGVEVEIFPDELNGINAFINDIRPAGVPELLAGINHLNGLQAWAFMSERNHDLDDISSNAERSNRQKRLISAALKKSHTLDLSILLNIIGDVIPLIQTNISMNDLLKITEKTLSIKYDQIIFQRSPIGSFSIKKINMHRLLVPDDMFSEIQFVHQFLAGD